MVTLSVTTIIVVLIIWFIFNQLIKRVVKSTSNVVEISANMAEAYCHVKQSQVFEWARNEFVEHSNSAESMLEQMRSGKKPE